MKKKLKAVLFDMDGVLFNSMPYHSEAWHKVMKSHGLTLSREEAYMHEGRTGAATINIVFQRELGREATQEEIESIYQEKSVLFNSYAEAERMPGAWTGSYGSDRFGAVIAARAIGAQLSGHVQKRIDGYGFRCKIRKATPGTLSNGT